MCAVLLSDAAGLPVHCGGGWRVPGPPSCGGSAHMGLPGAGV